MITIEQIKNVIDSYEIYKDNYDKNGIIKFMLDKALNNTDDLDSYVINSMLSTGILYNTLLDAVMQHNDPALINKIKLKLREFHDHTT